MDEQQEYQIEKIIKKKRMHNKDYYWIKWEGYGHDQNTWEPYDNLPAFMIQDFEQKGVQNKQIKRIKKISDVQKPNIQQQNKIIDTQKAKIQQQNKIIDNLNDNEYFLQQEKLQQEYLNDQSDDEVLFQNYNNNIQNNFEKQQEPIQIDDSIFLENQNIFQQNNQQLNNNQQNQQNQNNIQQINNNQYDQQVNNKNQFNDNQLNYNDQQVNDNQKLIYNNQQVNNKQQVNNDQQYISQQQNGIYKNDIEVEGSIEAKDQINQIIGSKLIGNVMYFKVIWKQRQNGIVPKQSKVKGSNLKQYDPQNFIKFIELCMK